MINTKTFLRGLFTALAVLLLWVPVTAMAQDDADDEEPEEIQEVEDIVVIGSRIPTGRPLDGSSPVQVITEEEIAASGVSDLGQLLQELPGAGSALNRTYNNGGEGSIRLSFRNLGSQRTLVLVDGRRWVASGTGADGSVDINSIPLGLVKRIEVLKDGASSIYGSDAMAAVVNIVTRDEYDGAVVSYEQGAFVDGGGELTKAEALFGIEGDSGNVAIGLTWVNSEEVGNSERAQTAARPSNGGSSGTPQGRFTYSGLRLDADNDNFLSADAIQQPTSTALSSALAATYTSLKDTGLYVHGNTPTAINVFSHANLPKNTTGKSENAAGFTVNEGAASALTGAVAGDFRAWHAGANGDGFNYNPYNYVITPNERRSVFIRGQFRATDRMDLTFKAVYQNRRSEQLLAPTPLFWGFSDAEGIGKDNAFNKLGVEFCGLDGKSAYGEKESCRLKATDPGAAAYYYTHGGTKRAVPTGFYKNGDTFGTGDSAAAVNRLYSYTKDDAGKDTKVIDAALFPDTAHADCTDLAAGAKCKVSLYDDAYLDSTGALKYVVKTTAADGDTPAKTELHKATSNTAITATAVAAGTDVIAGFIADDVAKKDAAGNVTYTQGVQKNNHATGWFGRRMLEQGPRLFVQDIETFHGEIGLKGDYTLGGHDWYFESSYSWSQNQAYVLVEGLFNTARVSKALGTSADHADYVKAADTNSDNKVSAAEVTAYNAVDGQTGAKEADRFVFDAAGNIACSDNTDGCVSLNIFGGQGADSSYNGGGLWSGSGSITKQMLDYVTFTAQSAGSNTQKLFTFNTAGTVVELPAGPLGMAVGYEYRDTAGIDQPDALINTGQTSGNARTATRGGYDVKEYYVEAAIPLIADKPGIQYLELSLSTRNSKFSNFGSTSTEKFAVKWEINDMFIVRATQNTGFRAPTVAELFQGLSDSYPQLADPCAATIAGDPNPAFVGDNFSVSCAPGGAVAGFDQPNGQIRITVGGNGGLKPETSEMESYGFVIKPMDNLSLFVDFWDITISDAIAGLGAQQILNRCYDPTAAGYSPGICGLVTRASDGSVSDLRSFSLNIAGVETSGTDAALVFDMTDEWRMAWDASYTDKWVFIDSLGGRSNLVGSATGSGRTNYTRLKSRFYTRYSSSDSTWYWMNELNYIHSVKGTAATPSRELKSVYYWDMQLSYLIRPINTRILLGLSNILDVDPPYYPESFANDFDPSYRMWGSQSWYVRVHHYLNSSQ